MMSPNMLLETMTSIRLSRLREQLAATGANDGGRVWLDLGSSLERVEQEVGLGVTVWERPIFRKERRSGPFFTIVEVETDEVIGMETRVDTPRLLNELNQRRMGDAVVREVLQRIDNGAAASFQDSFKVGPTTYSLVYDKDAGNVRIRYLD